MSISIIFPAFDEEKKIAADIKRADSFLNVNGINGEIIIVDDGSSDSTYTVANDQIPIVQTNLKIFKHDVNQGKGYAVKTGIANASKDIILYSDVGNIIPFDNALNAIKKIEHTNYDIMHASRKHPKSEILKEQDIDRKISSWMFRRFSKFLFNIPANLNDTQCGFKIYRKDVAKELYSKLVTKGFLFEIEIIIRALQANYKIVEFPVQWKCDRDSRINLLRTSPQVISEFLQLKRLLK